VADSGRRWAPWGRWVSYAELRASAEVAAVHVGQRVLAVPRHGHLVVVWSGRRPPVAVATGPDGRELGRVALADVRKTR
jgi:hypothetical protein